MFQSLMFSSTGRYGGHSDGLQSAVTRLGSSQDETGEKPDAQIAFDRRSACAGNRPALDRPGHGRHRLAQGKLHDQPDPVGGIWGGTRGAWPGPNLAKPALSRHREIRGRIERFDRSDKVAVVTGANALEHARRR